RTGGAHREELWTAFARRGLGFGATVPPSNTTSGVEEAFDLPDDLTVQPSAGLVASGELGGPFAPPGTTYTLANVGTNAVTWSAFKNATWYDLSTTTGTVPAGRDTVPLTVTINPTATTLPQGIYNDLLTFTNHQTHRTQSRRIRLRVGQPDLFSEQFDKDNDLAGHVHLFTPDSSASRYRVCRETASTFPTDPAEGSLLALEDDGFEEVALTDGKQVVLYGQSYGRVFVSANGFITFLAGTGEFAETLAGHFATPRISALFDDLNPEEGGTVSWRQLDDRLAVTWQDVPQFRASDRNNFQVELFFDGRIRLTHLDLGARDGLVGLSRGGGIADGFMESNFGSYGPCVEPLTLMLPSSTTEGAGLIQGEVALAETRATNVLVTLTSSDPDEIAVPGSVLIHAGDTRETFALSVGDDLRLDGSRLVRITARADGFGTRSASVSVHDNERAFLDLTLPARATEGDGFLPNAGRVHVDPVPDTDVAVNLVSADPTELVLPSVVIVPARSTGVNFDVTIGDDDWIDGSRSISAQASVQNWGTANAVMPVDDNESLDLTVVLPARVSEGNPVLRGAGSVRLSGRLPTNLVVRLATSDITELRVSQTTVSAGTTSAAFDLTVMDDPEVDGVQDVVVTAAADGFNPGTATLRVYDNESPPAPSNPTPSDLATNVPPFTDLAWSPGEGDIIVNGRFETGDLTGWRLESTGDGGFVINDGTFDPPGNEGPLPPFAGRFSALSQQTGSGRRALVQPVAIPPGATTAVLSWAHRVRNQASQFLDPDHEYRVEVRGPGATTLEVLFSTQPGDPLLQDWTEHSADLSRYIGQTVEIVFVENDLPGFLNVHLDNVSLTLGSASAPTAFEVYLGPTPELGETHRLGETSNPAWDLPRLDLDQTYFWQVVARRGAAQTPGPVWQFRVPGVGPVDHFAWSPIPSPQVAGRPFPATLTALDVFENEVASFEGTASLSGRTVLPEVTVGTGTNRWNFPLGAFNQDSRLQLILRTNEIGAERRITALTLEVDTAPPGTLPRFTVRMKHTL
ncbi:MAG: hypothetical protein IT186_16525, partial [Acidobacteria bacterium]|nr:hypothetical protein [Acidobacteriota bacterium]